MPVHSPFEHWVRRTPDAIALTHDDEELTYAELNRLANRIAHQLIALRSGPEALVAIVGERAPEFVAAILGTLKAGCAYLPLETDIPPRRLEELLDDARPEVVLLVRGGSLDAGRAPHVLRVDGALDGDDLPDPGLEISPRSLAYVLYTSGSTGRPKGVCVEHGSVSNLVDDFTRRLEITSSDRILHFGRLGFDVTVWELFVAFAAGAAVCGGAISTLHSPAALTQLMRARRVTVVCVVPALLGVLDPEDFPDVRMVVSVAEPFAGELVDRWGPGRRFFNGYGPTETTVLATTMECRPGSPGRPPIGKPGAGVRALLLDASLRPVPPGERGELCLGGVCVGRGYLGAPRLTADRFVPDPTGNGGRLYRTGDVVRENADGDLEFLGRIDDQLKVRGVRIEPVEVEAALGQVPAIRESAVTAQKLGGSAQLVAFVVLAESATLSDADLRAAAEELLPRPFVPQAFVRVEALPRSPNGKIDRKALPEALPLGGRGRSAETRLERELVRAWKEVLEVDDVSAEDSFLALGGDSVRAMQVAARLWRRLDIRVPVRLLVDASSLAEVAAGLAASEAASAPELEVRPDDRAPAAPGTERLFFLAEAQPASAAAYNVHLAVRLAGPLHVDALVASLERLVARHDALRTRLEATPAGVQAVVGPPAAPEIVRVRATEEELEALLGRAAARPFDLGAPPLLRASLFTLAPEDHVLLLVAPHAVVDGWSLGVLGDDLSALYQALRDGQEPPEPPALRHLDACRWQRSRTDEATEALAYWLRQLDGAPQDVDLVLDHGRPPVPSYRGGRVARRFPASLVRRLEEIGRENEATLYPCLLAAYAALLGRAAGQEELLIATPASDRPLPELERVVGFFVDTLVLRVDLSGRPSFAELVAHARGVLLEGLDHAPVPFDRLVADLAAARDPSRHPLVSVAFAYQGRRPVPRLPGVESRLVPVDNGAAKFDLLLDVEEAEDGSVVATLEYADLFERETAELLLDRLERLLEACAASPAARVDAVSLVAPEERRALLAPAARPASPPDACLHELLAARARANPKAPAVVCGGSSLTYGELVGQAGPLAQSLRAQGVGPEERVGICLERSCELVVAIAGVLEAGAAYVPLDPALPPERLRAIVEDAGIRVVVATPDLRELLPAEVTVVAPDAPAPATLAAPARVSPEAAAYVIYTSGSTGRPKGVVVTHANIVRLFEATEDFGFSERDVWTLFHSFAFDFSVWELWGALLHGGRLVVVPALTARAPAELLELLRCERVTVLNQTPTAFRLLQAAAAEDGFPPLSLRLVVFGGEALDPRSLRPWVEAYGERTRLVNMYGITETTVHVTARPLETADVTAAVSPIGEPLPDLQLLVLDERLEPVAPGMPGELHVSGPGVARGYLDRPRETAARFLPNPYGATGGRLYRSGDVAVRTLDGELLYLGRDDSQVKLRGHRIELGEIEAVLHEHPEVRDAVATLRALPAGEDGLVAYVVTNGTEPDPRELRRFVEVRLPQYMVPAAFVPLPRLPLTANGKLDARALPEPDGNGVSVSEHVAPRTETERQLAEIWSQLLGVERVGADDNFFALGGDSILSVRLAAEAAERGLGFSLEDVFLRPTLAALAEATTRADEPKLPEPEPEPMLPSAFPLTSLQLALVYDSELNPGAYRDLAGVTVRGPLDTAALANALSALCARHELLRVSLDLEGDDSPRHIVHERVQPTFEHADVRLATDADAELDRVRADLLRPFDWQRAPLLRCLVTRRSDATFQLDLAVHHAILDGWSLARVLSDLLLLYARELGDDVELPALPPVSYAELVRLEREALASPADGAFWRRSLDGAGASLQPGSGALGEIRRVAVPLDTETVERLQAQAARAGLPLKSVALAAHLAGLAAVTGSSDVVTGVVVDARPEVAGADRLAGLYLNVVALRADVRRDLLETARAAYAAEADLLPHRRFPAVEIRRLGAASNTLFNYAHFHLYRELERLRSVRVLDWTYVDRNTVPFTLDVLVDSLPDQVSLRFAFDPGAVDEDAALSLVDAVERALTDAAPARVRTSPVPVAGAS